MPCCMATRDSPRCEALDTPLSSAVRNALHSLLTARALSHGRSRASSSQSSGYTSQQRCFQRSSQLSVSSGWLLKSSVTAEFLAYLATALISAFLTVLWQRILCCIAAHWLPRCGALNALLTALLAALLTALWHLMPRCLVLTGFLAVRSGGCLPRHRSRFSHGFLAVHASSYDCSRASSLRSS